MRYNINMNILSKQQRLGVISALTVVVVVAIIAGGYYISSRNGAVMEDTTTTQLPGGGSITTSGSGSFTVEEVHDAAIKSSVHISAPNLKAPLVITADMSPEAQTSLRAKFAEAQKKLASNPEDFTALLYLGSLRKMAGDYTGAATVWVYITSLYPNDTVAFDNLGNLYMDFIKNYPKAESNYISALKANPNDIGAYRALYSLYTDYGYKTGTGAAEQILKQGIANNPKALDLHVLLARYYVANKNISAARTEYDSALALARAADQTDFVSQISAEEAKL